MSFDRKKSVIAVPRYDTDKIIGAFEGDLNIPASGTFTIAQNTISHDTGFQESCLPIGIYSTNFGATWNDMGAIVPSGLSFQTEECTASVSSTGIVTILGTNWYDTGTGAGRPAKTVSYKVWLLAKKNQGRIAPLPISAQPLYHSSRFNYQKIFVESVLSLTVVWGGIGSVSYTHNLGYIPNIRTWVNDSGTIRMNVTHSLLGGITFVAPEIRLDESKITFYLDNFFGEDYSEEFIFRIYLDG